MNVLVMGASGRVGRKVVALLQAGGHNVFAGTQHPHADLEIPALPVSMIDDLDTIKEALKGHDLDAIFQVAGSRGENLLQVDAYGAIKLEQAAEELGIDRFIMLSSFNATEPSLWSEQLRDYYIAKFFADNWLIKETSLNYTILQPGFLTEEIGTGKITINPTVMGANSIDNVAATLVASLDEPATYRKVITMADGDQEIAVALKNKLA